MDTSNTSSRLINLSQSCLPSSISSVIHSNNNRHMGRKTRSFISALFIAILLLESTSVFRWTQALNTDIGSLSDEQLSDSASDQLEPCELCRMLVKSFEKGLDDTARGKHEGGDTSWEERNLKSYADSEVRLIEIQEKLCEGSTKGKAQCLSLAEETETDIEEWWFKQRNKNVRLHDFLCISKLKRCCPPSKFGPTCQSCPSDCSQNGKCDGSGTRTGTGKCNCDSGYEGEHCGDCTDDHFRVATSDHFTCRPCHSACKSCYGPGATNCTECRSGYYQHETNGCIDINECDIGLDANGEARMCKGNTYCINTDGGYKCADCHVSCAGCLGYGSNMCISCAPGYLPDDEYSCRTREEMEKLDQWDREDTILHGKGTMARYFFYVGVLAVSVTMFRSNLYVVYTFTIIFVVFLLLSHFNLMDEMQDYPNISSE